MSMTTTNTLAQQMASTRRRRPASVESPMTPHARI
jgi:hypothetical protein